MDAQRHRVAIFVGFEIFQFVNHHRRGDVKLADSLRIARFARDTGFISKTGFIRADALGTHHIALARHVEAFVIMARPALAGTPFLTEHVQTCRLFTDALDALPAFGTGHRFAPVVDAFAL